MTVGAFDAVHLGHRALIRRAAAIAEPLGAEVVVLSFDPHPLAELRPGTEPDRITSWTERDRLLTEAGAARVVRLEPTDALLSLTADQFVEHIRNTHNAVGWVEGPDFRFGAGRTGDVSLLAKRGRDLGFRFDLIDSVETTLNDLSVVRVSSTLTRWLLANGRVADAAILLDRPHAVTGTVVQGHRRGRTIGFPTANLDLGADGALLPGPGVYAGEATLPDGRKSPAAISIGTNPTFGPGAFTCEPHLIGAPSDGDRIAGLPEYGWNLRVSFGAWLRDTLTFSGIEALVAQLERDRDRVLALSTETSSRIGETV